LMLGKWLYDWEGEAGLYNDEDAWFTDQVLTGFYWRKNLEKGDITLFAAHNEDNDEDAVYTELGDMYNYGARFNFQLNDKFRIALSGLYFDYDNDGTAKMTYSSAGAARWLWNGDNFAPSKAVKEESYTIEKGDISLSSSDVNFLLGRLGITSATLSDGDTFTTKLPYDITVNDVVVPAGTEVKVEYDATTSEFVLAQDVTVYENIPAFESKYYDYGTYWVDFGITFTPGFEFKGAYYVQDHYGPSGSDAKHFDDSPNAYKAIIDVSQDTLKFTSLWIEYAKFDPHFHTALSPWDAFGAELTPNLTMPAVSNVWETEALFVKLEQKWSDKWATFQRYCQFDHSPEGYATEPGKRLHNAGSFDITNWSIGVQYWYTPTVLFELAYDDVDYDDGWKKVDEDLKDDSLVRFRTWIFF